jgi:hypothetical protein
VRGLPRVLVIVAGMIRKNGLRFSEATMLL